MDVLFNNYANALAANESTVELFVLLFDLLDFLLGFKLGSNKFGQVHQFLIISQDKLN